MGWPASWCDPKRSVTNAETEDYRAEILRMLRTFFGEEADQRSAGGLRGIQPPEVLQSRLYGEGNAEGRPEAPSVCHPGAGAEPQGGMRSLRDNASACDSSQGSELAKQCPTQFADPVQFVSYVVASLRRGDVSQAREAALHALREPELSERGMQHLSDEDQAAWRSLNWEGRVACVIEAAAAVSIESRTHQLRQIGNGVVPLQAGCAFVVLIQRARGLTT